ncbi:MAG: hypothetical protein ABI120_12170, partial [Gemmatimonadaceae bacterium]
MTIRRAVKPIVTLSLLAALGSASACKKDAPPEVDPKSIVQDVGTENIALVKTDTLRTGPQLSGTLVPEREARLRAEVSGRVLQTMVEQGQRVSEGMLIGR